MDLTTDRRLRLISVAGAAVLVVLIASALAVWLNTGPSRLPVMGDTSDPYGLQTGDQAGSSASASASRAAASPSSSASPLAAPGPGDPSAAYKTIALLGLGGFDTEVTVQNPGKTSWKVMLTMPEDKPVENRTPSAVKLEQKGVTVTLTPVTPSAETVKFTVRFPDLLALGKSITGCTVDGRACTAA